MSSDAFGIALGNSIVGGIQKSAAEKRQEELNKYSVMSAKLGADASITLLIPKKIKLIGEAEPDITLFRQVRHRMTTALITLQKLQV